MLGWVDPRPRRLQAVLAQDIALDKERPEYHRATLDWEANDSSANLPLARSTGRQISSRLTSMRGAEALLELPRGPGFVAKGTVVSALVIRDIGTQGGLQMPRVRPKVVRPETRAIAFWQPPTRASSKKRSGTTKTTRKNSHSAQKPSPS
jgi:hypothetical protein